MWDPEVYGRYAGERARPFFELLARVAADTPRLVVDAGCGTGELTVALARRWPAAMVHGFDASPSMIAKALRGRPADLRERVTFEVGDVREPRLADPVDVPVDVLVSNAVLQWVPEHREILSRWVGVLAPGGWLAVQMPGNFAAPSHAAIRELCRTTWKDRLADLARHDPVGDPMEYLELLAGLGCRVDAWETTYVHVLPGDDAVLKWISGTALRPMLDRLTEAERPVFLADCAAALARSYPRRPYGTPFPFRRIFAVARREG
jgi:trans-aconitate 2-methyltransferase